MDALARKLGLMMLTASVGGLLGGCASISSQKIKPAEFQNRAAEGLIYHLPRRGVRFDISVGDTPRTAAFKMAQAALTSAVTSATAARNSRQAEQMQAEIGAEDARRASCAAGSRCGEHRLSVTRAEHAVAAAKAATTLAEQELAAVKAKNAGVETALKDARKSVGVTAIVVDNAATETVADMRSSYLLRYNKNLVADNSMAVAVNGYGLLSISHAQSVNRLNDIAANAAAAAVALSTGIGPGLGGTPPAPTPTMFKDGFAWTGRTAGPAYAAPLPNSATVAVDRANAGACAEGDKFSVVVDPLEVSGEKDRVPEYWSRSLCGVDLILVRDFSPEAKPYDDRESASMAKWKLVSGANIVGRAFRNVVYYKQNMSYTVGICPVEKQPCNTPGPAPAISLYEPASNACLRKYYQPDGAPRFDFTDTTSTLKATSPNESPVYHAGISRTVFADSTSDISLHNGVISAVENSGSSEMLGAVRIPTSMLNATTSAVSGVFSSLQGISKAQNNYVISQTGEKLSEGGAVAALAACQAALAQIQLAPSDSDKATAIAAAKTACPQTAQP